MKATGVVRRVDDLGRIVIPKEIRRNLKIRDGEELEIFVDDENVILRKFSKVADFSDVAKKIVDVVSSLVGKTILITDRDKFITGSGNLKRNYINKSISKKIGECLSNRYSLISRNIDSIELVNNEIDNYAYIISPVISYGDVIGTVILIANSDISDFDITINDMISQFLGKYVED